MFGESLITKKLRAEVFIMGICEAINLLMPVAKYSYSYSV